jgi:hypothetical protein
MHPPPPDSPCHVVFISSRSRRMASKVLLRSTAHLPALRTGRSCRSQKVHSDDHADYIQTHSIRFTDSIALAERINLFWSIFLADRTGSIGTGLPVVIKDGDIETPWPRRFEDFGLVRPLPVTNPTFLMPSSRMT